MAAKDIPVVVAGSTNHPEIHNDLRDVAVQIDYDSFIAANTGQVLKKQAGGLWAADSDLQATEIIDQVPVDAGSASANIASKVKATAGVEADANWAQTISQETIRFMIAIAPDAGGATVVELEARTVEVVVD